MVLDGYMRFRAVADRGLEAMAGDVATNVVNEMEGIRDQLAAYDATVTAGAVTTRRPCQGEPVAREWFATPSPVLPLAFTPKHLYLEQAAWIAPSGTQVWKITSKPKGELLDLEKRPYFRAVRDGRLFTTDSGKGAFFVAPDRSISDGRFYTFLSIRSQLSDACAAGPSDRGPYVAVATARLQSVDRQPLPAGYGFAIIDREGRVLYHSDARLSLRQNLFRELGAGRDVRAMVYSDQERFASSHYQERPTRLFLRPLALTPDAQTLRSAGLYVVAFSDLSLERAVVARAFVTSLAGPLPLLVALLCAAILVGSWVSRRSHGSPGHWLWPHGGLTPMYKRLTAVFLVAMLVGLVGRAFER